VRGLVRAEGQVACLIELVLVLSDRETVLPHLSGGSVLPLLARGSVGGEGERGSEGGGGRRGLGWAARRGWGGQRW